MQIKVGVDILSIPRFLASLENGKEAFLKNLFTPLEIRENTPEQLASLFCLKEAVHKAFELPPGSWQKIHLKRQENGKLQCHILDESINKSLISLDTSISHEETQVVAVISAIIENK